MGNDISSCPLMFLELNLVYIKSGFFKDMYLFNADAKHWVNLTKSTSGSIPTARSHFGISSVGNFLYLFGGWSAAGQFYLCKKNCSELSLMVLNAGLLNDLFQFDIDKFLWTDLSNQIRGDAPLARYGHSLESVGNFLYVLGGLGNTSEFMLLVANVLIIYL